MKNQNGLQAFFSYFGSKYRLAKYYPEPKYETIIEPMAGSAAYSLRYYDRQIILNDLDPIIARLWQYLIHVSEEEILSLPLITKHIDEVSYLSQEAQLLIRYWLTKGTGRPRKTLSRWARDNEGGLFWSERVKERIASQLQYIRHWKIHNMSYEQLNDLIGNPKATWFIDSPYQHSISREYTHSTVDYNHLTEWIHTRNGEVIVCEKEGADWLPFQYLARGYTSHNHTTSHEVHYYKDHN
jgi:site-specific DNA-adenine methylase